MRDRGFAVNGDILGTTSRHGRRALPVVGGPPRVAGLRDRRGRREGRPVPLWRELGVTGREPRWAVAWKFPPITATTTLNRIVWNVGRTGRLLPFAMLEPVHVGGVTVSTATLHNEEDLAKKDVRERDEVVVTRAGDVIPQVIAPLIQRREGKRLRKASRRRSARCAGRRRSSPRTRMDDLPKPARLPGSELPARQALPRRDGHRGAGGEEPLSLPRRGPDHRPGLDLRPEGGDDRRLEGFGETSATR